MHVLRTVEDSDALRAVLDAGGRLVVIGAGWIGSEVAASARQRGMEVAMVEMQSLPLEGVLGRELGAFYRDVHAEHGVELHLGTGVEAIEGAGRAERVRTSDGAVLECSAVLLGVGVAPRTALAEGVLKVDNGIVVDAGLRTSAEGVYAAGDVANQEHPLFGPLRVEHWANALEQGPAAARAMLGEDVSYERDSVLLLRPVRRRDGVRGTRKARRRGRLPRRPGHARVHRLLAARRMRRGRHERQRVGRQRRHPGARA